MRKISSHERQSITRDTQRITQGDEAISGLLLPSLVYQNSLMRTSKAPALLSNFAFCKARELRTL